MSDKLDEVIAKYTAGELNESTEAQEAEPGDEVSEVDGVETAEEEQAVEPEADGEESESETEEETEELEADEAPKAKDPKAERFSKGFAKLAQEERKLRELRHEVEQGQRQLKQMRELQELAKSNPIQFAEKMGLNYDQWTNQILTGEAKLEPQLSPEQIKAQVLEEVRKEQAAQQAKHQQEKLVQEFKSGLKSHLSSGEYPYIEAYGDEGADTTYNVIVEHLNQTGNLMSYEEAAGMVNGYYEQQAEKLLKIKEKRGKLTKNSNTTQEIPPQKPLRKSGKTLKNTSGTPTREKKTLSEEDRILNAIKLWKTG